MRNLCQIFSEKVKKVGAFTLVLCLIWGLTPAADSISVKLRGKIALAGILSGLAYATHTLVKRDRRAVEELRLHLGPPERIVQFERGFDLWRIDYYEERCYMFRNNRFIKSTPCVDLQSVYQAYSIVQFERGFDLWRIDYYEERCYMFRNNRFIKSTPCVDLQSVYQAYSCIGACVCEFVPPFLIDTPVLVRPMWLRLCPLHPREVPQFVSSYLYRSEDERSLDLEPWLSR